MSSINPDRPEDTTVTLKRIAPGFAWLPRMLRENFTPRAAWAVAVAIWTLIVALTSAGLTMYSHSVGEEKDIAQLKDNMKKLDEQGTTLQGIASQLAAMGAKVDAISTEVEHQREWRDRIEQQAEAAPHARWNRR